MLGSYSSNVPINCAWAARQTQATTDTFDNTLHPRPAETTPVTKARYTHTRSHCDIKCVDRNM